MKIVLPPPSNPVPENRAETHRALLARKVYTKSMILKYQRCPVEFEQEYILHKPTRLGWSGIQGLVLHELLEEAIVYAKMNGAAIPKGQRLERMKQGLQRHAPKAAGEPAPFDLDVMAGTLVRTFEVVEPQLAVLAKDCEGVERSYGEDDKAPVLLGGVRIACKADLVLKSTVWDWKVVGSSSAYRKPKVFSLEAMILARATGKMRAGFRTLVTTLKSGPVADPPWALEVTPVLMHVAEEQVSRIVAQIEKGNFPPTVSVGDNYPCNSKHCAHWGTCPVTVGMPMSVEKEE